MRADHIEVPARGTVRPRPHKHPVCIPLHSRIAFNRYQYLRRLQNEVGRCMLLPKLSSKTSDNTPSHSAGGNRRQRPTSHWAHCEATNSSVSGQCSDGAPCLQSLRARELDVGRAEALRCVLDRLHGYTVPAHHTSAHERRLTNKAVPAPRPAMAESCDGLACSKDV